MGEDAGCWVGGVMLGRSTELGVGCGLGGSGGLRVGIGPVGRRLERGVWCESFKIWVWVTVGGEVRGVVELVCKLDLMVVGRVWGGEE